MRETPANRLAIDSNAFFYVNEPDKWACYLDPEKDLRKYWFNSTTEKWFYAEG